MKRKGKKKKIGLTFNGWIKNLAYYLLVAYENDTNIYGNPKQEV